MITDKLVMVERGYCCSL